MYLLKELNIRLSPSWGNDEEIISYDVVIISGDKYTFIERCNKYFKNTGYGDDAEAYIEDNQPKLKNTGYDLQIVEFELDKIYYNGLLDY